VAIVTGANHGIGAATAVALAARGCSVLCTFLRIDEPAYRPAAYRDNRAQNADAVVGQIRDTGGRQPHPGAIEQDHRIPVLPQVKRPEPGLSNGGAGGARTHDRRIMSPTIQSAVP
jgi:3-oxoacyl-[acyl-carrier protein] reductase